MPNIDDYILVNQWVQGIVQTNEIVKWYQSLADDRKLEVMHLLANFCKQARVSVEDGAIAVESSQISPKRSAAVLLHRGAGTNMIAKLVGLKRSDGVDAFILLLHLLRIADHRRRLNEVPGSCSHWWHQDLSDPLVLERIRKAYAQGMLG